MSDPCLPNAELWNVASFVATVVFGLVSVVSFLVSLWFAKKTKRMQKIFDGMLRDVADSTSGAWGHYAEISRLAAQIPESHLQLRTDIIVHSQNGSTDTGYIDKSLKSLIKNYQSKLPPESTKQTPQA